MPILKCHKTTFYSQLDEEMFFDALKRISAVKKVEGSDSDILISVQSRISDEALRGLLGLFFRYRIDMRQLAPFIATKSRDWSGRSEAFWFKRVFAAR